MALAGSKAGGNSFGLTSGLVKRPIKPETGLRFSSVEVKYDQNQSNSSKSKAKTAFIRTSVRNIAVVMRNSR